MNKEEILSKLYNKNTVIYCENENEKKELSNFLKKNTNLKWRNGKNIEDFVFNQDCLYLNDGNFLTQGSYSLCVNIVKYNIIKFKDLFNDEVLNNKCTKACKELHKKQKRKIMILE